MKITQLREKDGNLTLSTTDLDTFLQKIKTETKTQPVSTFRQQLRYCLPGKRCNEADRLPKVLPAAEFRKTNGVCQMKTYNGTMKDLRIEIDDKSGFCFGVVRAISEAEKALAGGETVYSLGDIVHNRIEVQRLEKLGLSTVTHADMPRLTGRRLFIRAHGEPPTTYARAAELGIEVIDATCPVVARLQARVVKAHERMRPAGGQVVILGKRGHAEVVGLTGQVPDRTIVVEGEEDLSQIDFTRPVYFLSQTTQSIALFEALGAEMRRRAANPADVHIDDTICRQVSSREQHLQEFARRFDAVVFVCGRKSSNGRVLFEVCRTANPRTCNIEEAAEIDPAWFEGAESVGICGATSTPKWLMQEVADRIGKIGKGK